LRVTLPGRKPCDYAYVLKIVREDEASQRLDGTGSRG
jgi:hypothetical protein